MRTAGRIALWVVSIAAVVIGGVLLYLSTGPGERWIKKTAERTLGEMLDATVTISRLETNVWSRLEIEGVEVRRFADAGSDPAGPSTPGPSTATSRSPIEYLRVDRLRVRYGLLTLLFEGLEVDSVLLSGAEISIRTDSIPSPHAAPDTSIRYIDDAGRLTPPLRVGYADLSNVQVDYDDRSIPMALSGSRLAVTLGMDEEWRGEFRVAADSVSFDYFDSPVNLNGLVMAGSLNRVGQPTGGAANAGTTNAHTIPVAVDSLRFNVAGMELSGALNAQPDSLTGRLSVSGDPRILLDAISDGLDETIDRGPIRVDAAFAIIDPLDAAVVRWSIGMPSAMIEGVPVSNLGCDGTVKGDTLTIDKLTMGVYGGTVAGRGWMAIDSPYPHQFGITAKGVRVSDYWKSRTKPGQFTRIPVSIDARIDSRGNLLPPADVSVKSGMSIYSGKSLVAAPAIDYARRHLSVRSKDGMARIAAEIDLRGRRDTVTGYDGTVELVVPSIGTLAPLFGVRGVDGAIEGEAYLSGDRSDLVAAVTVSGDGISYKHLVVADELHAEARWKDDELVIQSATVTGWAVELAELANVLGVEVPANVPGAESAADSVSGTAGISGTVGYTLTAHGPIGNPEVALTAKIEQPSYGTLRFDSAALHLTLADSVATLDHLIFAKDSSSTTVKGTVDLRGPTGDLEIEFRNPDPDTVRATFAYTDSANYFLRASTRHFGVSSVRPYVPGLPLAGGQVGFDLDLRSTNGRVDAVLPFAVTELTYRKGTVDSITGTLRYDDGEFSVDSMSLSNEGHRFFAGATLALKKNPDGSHGFDWDCRTKGSVTGDAIQLTRILPFLVHPVDVGGAVDLDLRWDGLVKRPNFTGTIDVSGVRYGPVPKSPWFTGLTGRIHFGVGTLSSDSLTAMIGKLPVRVAAAFERGDSTNFTASFDLVTDSTRLLTSRAAFTGDSIDVLFESEDLDVAALQPFAEGLKKLKGRLTTRVTVAGPFADPVVDGRLALTGVSFEPGTSGVPLTAGTVSARLSGGRLVLDSVSAEVGGGRVFASGTASVDSGALKDVDIGVRASGIKVTKKNLVQLNVKSADLKLKSAKERYDLTGVIEFGETRYVRDIEIGDIVRMMKPETDVLEEPKKEEPLDLMTTMREQVAEPGETPEFLKKVDFDIELRNADGLWIDNNLAKFRTNHDLRLHGNFDEATLTGRIDVRDRGELIFLDRRFEIINGVIDCSDPRRLNPVINLTATCDVTESSGSGSRPTRYTITLTISGPLDEFDYALTSNPSLEQSDIVSLLALGMTQYQLESGGNKDAVYKDRSEVIASQQISNSVNRFFDNLLGDLLALDHIGIGGNLFDPNETRFEVTKRWSDRVEIRYSTSITNVDEQILSAEYKINDFLYLEGKTDQMEDSGADLKFRIWFK